jgi:hypothetical protein
VKDTVSHQPAGKDSLSLHAADMIPNQTRYFYEPDTATVNGTIIRQTFYGPPGYGESPETDSKETYYLLVVSQAIKVFSNSEEQEAGGTDVTAQNVDTIQLVPMDGINLKPFFNRKAQLTGTFFGPVSGHHHTPVLLQVIRAEALR